MTGVLLPPQRQTKPKQTFWVLVRVGIGGALLYYITSRTRNWEAAKQLLATGWLFPLLAVQTLYGLTIESKRMGVLFRSQGIEVPFGWGCRVSSIASFFSVCIPGGTGGDVMKLYYLSSRNPGKGLEIATVLLLDRIVAMCALLSLIVGLSIVEGSLIHHAVIRVLILIAVALLVALPCFGMLCCSARIRSSRRYRAVLSKLPLRRHIERIGDAVYAFRDHKAALAAAAALAFSGHLMLAFVFAAAGSVVLPQAPVLVVCVLALLGMFANALPITPGGLGVGESAFQGLFALAGFSGGASLMLTWRLSMALQCLIGCPLYIRGIRPPQSTDAKDRSAYAGVASS